MNQKILQRVNSGLMAALTTTILASLTATNEMIQDASTLLTVLFSLVLAVTMPLSMIGILRKKSLINYGDDSSEKFINTEGRIK